MIIYKCIISGDEMFSDIYKITESEDGLFYHVQGSIVSRTEKIDDSMIGGNASAEEVAEVNEASSITGVDIVINHNLQQTFLNKKSYVSYLKEYVKVIKNKLKETNPDRVDAFEETCKSSVGALLKNINNYDFYTGESQNVEGSLGLLDYKEDGVTPFMIFFKDGLEIEKC